jgi:hypothetical protein
VLVVDALDGGARPPRGQRRCHAQLLRELAGGDAGIDGVEVVVRAAQVVLLFDVAAAGDAQQSA